MAIQPSTVKCPNCAAAIDTTAAVGGVVKCRYCKQPVVLPKTADEAAYASLEIAKNYLNLCNFDGAFDTFKSIADKFPDEPEAYFGMALAASKVRYIKDIENNCLRPICYGATNKTFVSDGNYIKALSFSTVEQKAEYMRQANEIDYIRNEFYKFKQSGKEYDCFICVKVSSENGRKTLDSERANDIYYHLKDKGYRPFYSEREIQNETGADYEARILYALFSSPCMLVVCSDESYLQTPWVKNEYSRFISLINDEQKEADSIAIGFFDTPIERLPGRNGRLQGVCLTNPDAYSKIVDFVDKHYNINTEAPQLSRKTYSQATYQKKAVIKSQIQKRTLAKFEQTAITVSEQSKLDIAKSMLESSNFDAAISRCRSILVTNKSCALAYWYMFLAENKCKNSENFALSQKQISSFDSLESAIATADKQLKNECYNVLFNRAMTDRQLYIYEEYISLPDSSADDIKKLTAAIYSDLLEDIVQGNPCSVFDTIIKTVDEVDTYIAMNVKFAEKLFALNGSAALKYYRSVLESDPAHSLALWRTFVLDKGLYIFEDLDNINDNIDSAKLLALINNEIERNNIENYLFCYGFNEIAEDALFEICLSEIDHNINNVACFDFLLSLIPTNKDNIYVERLFSIVNAAIANRQYELAERYNDRIIVTDKLNDNAYFNRIYIKNRINNPFAFFDSVDTLYDMPDFSTAIDIYGECNPTKENIYIEFVNKFKTIVNQFHIKNCKFIATYYDLTVTGVSCGVYVLDNLFSDAANNIEFCAVDKMILLTNLFQRNDNYKKAHLDEILHMQSFVLSPKQNGTKDRKIEIENAEKHTLKKQAKKLIDTVAQSNPEQVAESYLAVQKREKITNRLKLCALFSPAVISFVLILGIIKPTIVFGIMHFGGWIALCIVVPFLVMGISSFLYNKCAVIIRPKSVGRLRWIVINAVLTIILMIVCLVLARVRTITVSNDYEFNSIKNSPTTNYIYNVSNANQIKEINKYHGYGNRGYGASCEFNLIKDIDFNGETIDPIVGIKRVNGNGHKLSNFVISIKMSSDEVESLSTEWKTIRIGLFGSLSWGGEFVSVVDSLTIDGARYEVEINGYPIIICGAIVGNGTSLSYSYERYKYDYSKNIISNCTVTNCVFDFSRSSKATIHCNEISGQTRDQKNTTLTDCTVLDNTVIYP